VSGLWRSSVPGAGAENRPLSGGQALHCKGQARSSQSNWLNDSPQATPVAWLDAIRARRIAVWS
jgi:hypothetical protein